MIDTVCRKCWCCLRYFLPECVQERGIPSLSTWPRSPRPFLTHTNRTRHHSPSPLDEACQVILPSPCLVKSVSASFSNAVHAVAIHSHQQLSGLGILGKPDSPKSWTEVVRGRFAYRLPNLFCFFSAGFKIWNEHSRDSSTLIMAPALSNSPQ